MTVKELKQKIEYLPDNMDVFVTEKESAFAYGLVEKAEVREIGFQEDVGGPTLSREKVLIISDEI